MQDNTMTPQQFIRQVDDIVRDFVQIERIAEYHDETLTIAEQLQDFIHDKSRSLTWTNAVTLKTFEHWRETNTTPSLSTIKYFFLTVNN